jgi:protein SCO1/2
MTVACLSCGRKEVRQPETGGLPFFNQPDWTPEWIERSDPRYDSIHTVPPFSFTDQRGSIVTERDITGRICVANFFFIRCRNICPKMTTNMHLLQDAFRSDSSVVFLSHSVDPESDSVPVLRQYAADNDIDPERWHLLTGDRDAIYGIAKKEYFAGDSIGYYQAGRDFLHTEHFILLDRQRRIRGVYNGTLRTEIDRIREDIAILQQE